MYRRACESLGKCFLAEMRRVLRRRRHRRSVPGSRSARPVTGPVGRSTSRGTPALRHPSERRACRPPASSACASNVGNCSRLRRRVACVLRPPRRLREGSRSRASPNCGSFVRRLSGRAGGCPHELANPCAPPRQNGLPTLQPYAQLFSGPAAWTAWCLLEVPRGASAQPGGHSRCPG